MYDKFSSNSSSAVWPDDLPQDLHWTLRDTLSYQSCNPQDVWEAVREWLVLNGVPPCDPDPEHRPNRIERPIGSTKFTATDQG